MAATATPPNLEHDEPDLAADARETNGLTSRLMLAYAKREGGREAVDAVLAGAGCSGLESELNDENTWFSFDRKISLFEALVEVLRDPDATRKAGASALEANVGEGLKIALRALGSPRLVYQHIVRANAKFSVRHEMRLLDLGADSARMEFVDVTGGEIHELDCNYTIGLLSCVPALFGQAPARVSHPACAALGAERCVYELKWDRAAVTQRDVVLGTVATGAAATLAALAAPALLPAAAALGVALAGAGAARVARFRRSRLTQLETEVLEQASAAERLSASLQDVVSELRLDEVLDKIVHNAHAAVSGKEFALLVDEDGRLACRSSTGLPVGAIATLEAWAAASGPCTAEPVLVEDVSVVPALAPLRADPARPTGTLCAAPLTARGEIVGILVALAPVARTFLERDVDVVRSYAAQAAIALVNARVFEAQKALATRDPLTGLLNHREFHESVSRELNRCRRHGGAASVVLFDLDGFKLVNDGAGHAEGDRVLREAAAALARSCRDSDVAFRIGGDEFALLLPETSGADAEIVGARARDAIATVDARTSASYGIASWPADGGSKDVVLAQADANLYAMKRGQRRRPRAAAAMPEAELQRERLVLASRLAGRLALINDPVDIAERAVRELHESFDYPLAYIQRLEGDRLRAITTQGAIGDFDPTGWEQGADEGVCGRVANTGRSVLIHDCTLDSDHLGPDYLDPDASLTYRSQITVALKVGERVWGVLGVEHQAPAAFTSDDVLLLETVGAQVAAALHRSELLAELDSAFTTTLSVLCDALETKDDYTASHAHDVGQLAVRVGEELGLDAQALRNVQYAALLHDIGKIAVPTEILTKPGPLTPQERVVMETHTVVGAEMLERIPFFASVHPLVRASHERWDGRGYPDGLAGEDIPLEARIVCACDAFHAMTSDRPYRAALPRDVAIDELHHCAGRQFDPAVVEALVAALL